MSQPRKHLSNAARQAAYRARHIQAVLTRGTTVVPARPTKAPRLPQKPGARRWALLLAQAQAALQTVADEMEAYHNDRSEQWQEGDRGEAFMERLEAVQGVLAAFDEVPQS